MRKVTPGGEPLRMLIEADPGGGKTRLADTANLHKETSPALHLDLRGNTVTLAVLTDWEHYIVEIDNQQDLRMVYEWLASGQADEGRFSELAGWFPKVEFRTLILDTLTQWHHMTLNQITGNVQKVIGQTTKQPQIQDWGELLRQTVFLMSKLGDLPLHVIVTVQSSETQDKVTGAMLHRPQLWGKSVKEVPAFVYIHAYLLQAARLTQLQKTQMGLVGDDLSPDLRVAMFTPRFDSMAKDQYGVLGPHMVEPSIPKIVDMIYPDA